MTGASGRESMSAAAGPPSSFGPRLVPARRGTVRRRRSRRVYFWRRIIALILVVVVILVLAVGVDKIVRAVQPAHHSTKSTQTGQAAARTHTSVPAKARSGGAAPKPKTVPAVAAPAGHTTVVLSAVGDTELGTTGDLPPDPASYLDLVQSDLAAPIVFGNLEGTLSTDTSSKCAPGATDCYAFQDPPSYAGILYADGFDVLNSANNHSDDFGPEGVAETSAALKAAKIVQAGLPNQIGVISDGDTQVAFVDFAPYDTTNDLLDLPAAKALIKRAKTLASVVIVYMHAGAEGAAADHVTGEDESYLGEDRGNPEAFAKAAIDDGAAAVIASGPHVLRGLQFYRGHLIAYSLGDFAGYQNFSTSGILDLSGILHLQLSPTGAFVKGRWTSLKLNGDGQPAVDPTGAAAKLVNSLSKADFGTTAALIGAQGLIVAAPATSTTTTTAG
jgi:hypothetical protein